MELRGKQKRYLRARRIHYDHCLQLVRKASVIIGWIN